MVTRPQRPIRYRRLGGWGAVMLAGVMWNATVPQLTNGVLDVVVFVPPGAVLGVATVWSGHAFAPERFSWGRGLIGAVVGGLVMSPLLAFLVAFSAAWDRASFPLVFPLGALLAIALGLGVGAVGWVFRWAVNGRSSAAGRGLTPGSDPGHGPSRS